VFSFVIVMLFDADIWWYWTDGRKRRS